MSPFPRVYNAKFDLAGGIVPEDLDDPNERIALIPIISHESRNPSSTHPDVPIYDSFALRTQHDPNAELDHLESWVDLSDDGHAW